MAHAQQGLLVCQKLGVARASPVTPAQREAPLPHTASSLVSLGVTPSAGTGFQNKEEACTQVLPSGALAEDSQEGRAEAPAAGARQAGHPPQTWSRHRPAASKLNLTQRIHNRWLLTAILQWPRPTNLKQYAISQLASLPHPRLPLGSAKERNRTPLSP